MSADKETLQALDRIVLGWLLVVLALILAIVGLDSLGPEPEIGAADYRQMQCEYMPDAPECNVKRVQIAEK